MMNRLVCAAAAIGMLIVATASLATDDVKSSEEILKGLGVMRGPGGAATAPGGRTGATVDLEVQFEYNSAALTPQAVSQLQALAQALSDPTLTSSRFQIEGHTDADGSTAYNMTLSNHRAAAVKAFLVEHGISATRLQARGYGESRPISDGTTAEGKARDRRVAVVNLGSAAGPQTTKQAPPPPAARPQSVEKSGSEASTKAKPQTKSAASALPEVKVVVQYERNGQKDQVKPGTVLRPVDNYNVAFTPAKRSYVYVFQFDAGGNATIVFPNKEHSATVNPVVAAKTYVIPSDGKWLRLRETPGEEEIVVVASAEAIEDARAVAQAVRKGIGSANRGVEPFPVKDSPVQMPADLFSYRLQYKTQLP